MVSTPQQQSLGAAALDRARAGARILRNNPPAAFGLALVVVYVFVAAAGPTIAPHPYDEFAVGPPLAAPSFAHPFGTGRVRAGRAEPRAARRTHQPAGGRAGGADSGRNRGERGTHKRVLRRVAGRVRHEGHGHLPGLPRPGYGAGGGDRARHEHRVRHHRDSDSALDVIRAADAEQRPGAEGQGLYAGGQSAGGASLSG